MLLLSLFANQNILQLNRRSFSKKMLSGTVISGLSTPLFALSSPDRKKKSLKPKRLKRGQNIGLITPGSPVSEEQFQKAVIHVENLGLKPVYTKNVLARHGYLAGKDSDRLNDLHQMFSDPNIDGIWCIRGGYGCTRLLQKIDFQTIRKNPKVLIGYSDITALLQAIYKKTGLICFHGPVAASKPTDYTVEHFQKVVMNPVPKLVCKNAVENQINEGQNYQTKVIRPGHATGKLIGGNLSLVSALAGTKYAIPVTNKILFLEDVGEKPYRIDRMLTQLRQACDLRKASAIVLGIFEDCEGDENSLSLMETLEDRLGDLNIPVIYGMSFGHIEHQFTLPVGVKAILDTEKEEITLLESAVM